MLKPKKQSIQFRKYTGVSKKSGKEFHCFEFKAGDFTTLIFPRGRIEYNYLSQFVTESAHADFQDGDDLDEPIFDRAED